MATAAREEKETALPLLLPSPAEKAEAPSCWRQWAREAGRLGYLALPMLVASLSQYAVQVSSNMVVGHLTGVLPLSSAAIATSLDRLRVQPSRRCYPLWSSDDGRQGFLYHKLGVDTYRAIVTLLVVCIPLSVLWVFMGKILVLIGQDPLIAQGAGRYIVWLIPGLFANALLQPITKFLQTQSLIFALLLSSVATLAIHIPLSYVMVFKTGFGYTGAALSTSISYWLNVLMLVGYIALSSSYKDTRTPPTIEAFKDVDVFLRLALPSALMICLEWWSFELLILLSGLLPNPELQSSVLSICLTSVTLLYTNIPYGLGASGSTRVANELGAGNSEGARISVRVVMSVAAMEVLIVGGTLLALRHLVGRAYSSEEEVISFVATMVPLVCITVVTDGFIGVLSGTKVYMTLLLRSRDSGIARGCGWQHLGAYVNLGSFYLIGLPMAIVLGFVLNMGGRGLWMGIICGSLSQTTLLSAITIFTEWHKMAEKARERVFNDKPSEPGSRRLLE
ncbi:hypothetical protein EJB05_42595, partial [Eragrostis curvula]